MKRAWIAGTMTVMATLAGRVRADEPPIPPAVVAAVAAVASSPPPAPPAPPAPPPSSGTLLIVLGSLGIAGGVAEAAFMPLCFAGRVPTTQRPACVGVSAAAGVALLGVGISLTVLGAGRRSAWLESQRVGLAVVPGGAGLGWRASW